MLVVVGIGDGDKGWGGGDMLGEDEGWVERGYRKKEGEEDEMESSVSAWACHHRRRKEREEERGD